MLLSPGLGLVCIWETAPTCSAIHLLSTELKQCFSAYFIVCIIKFRRHVGSLFVMFKLLVHFQAVLSIGRFVQKPSTLNSPRPWSAAVICSARLTFKEGCECVFVHAIRPV